MSLPNLLAATSAPWAVAPGSVPAIQALLASARKPEAEMTAALGDGMPRVEGRIARGVAVVPVRGFLLNRCNAFEEYFGCCSVERLSATIDALMGDESVTAIVLSFDSPGGSVMGIEELARKILSLRDVKPIVASVDAMSASAAYWLASACSEVWVTPSGMVGAVGTLMIRADTSKADAESGYVFNVIAAGTYKGEGLPYEPMSAEERKATQTICDSYYALFTGTVAKGRGVTPKAVQAGFGEGRVVTAKDAVGQGMADKVGSISDVLGKYAGRSARNGMRALAAVGEVVGARPFSAFTNSIVAAIGGPAPVRMIPIRAVEGEPEDDEELTQRPEETDEEFEARKTRAADGDPDEDEDEQVAAGDDEDEERVTAAEDDEDELVQRPDETDEAFEERKRAATAASALGGVGVGASTPAVALTPDTAPKAKEPAMASTPAAPIPGADSRVSDIMALATTHKKDLAWASAQIASGKGTDAIRAELLAEHADRLAASPDISARVGAVGAPREANRPYGDAEYGALAEAVRAGTLPRTDSRFERVHAAAFGEFLTEVQAAFSPGGQIAPRLAVHAAAQGMNQGVPSEGGFAVLPQFSNVIYEGLSSDPNSLLSMTDNYTVEGESLTFPANAETSRATGSRFGGIQGYWINEADQITKSKPKLRNVKVEPQELAVLVYLTDKVIRNNSVGLGQYVNRAATEEITFMSGDAIVNGTGAGQPKGIMASGALISVAKETSQVAATFVKANVNKMWARLHPRSRANAVWLVNVDVEPQFDDFNTLVKNVAGSENVGGFGSQIYNAEKNTLKGRPIVFCEFAQTLGTVGDVILADMKGYLTGTRGDGVRQDMSMHVRFEYAEQAFRFMYELDGQPWLAAPLTPHKGSNTLSTFVACATR